MRHFYRSHLTPREIVAAADEFFPRIEQRRTAAGEQSRTFTGPLGTLELDVRMEGGHYTFVQIDTDQMGESRLDRNAKRFFVQLHRTAHPAHAVPAAF